MEESISSSRTAGASFFYDCFATGGPHAAAEASEDSGWTAYFYDDGADNCLQLQASEKELALTPLAPTPSERKSHRLAQGLGDRASASTVSTASKSKVKAKKEEKKKRPRWESAGEDPLQDTASSMPAITGPDS